MTVGGRLRPHQASTSGWSPACRASVGEPFSDAACPSRVAYLTSKEKRRRSLSSASGPGLEKTLTTPSSETSPAGLLRLSCVFLSSISRGYSWSFQRRPSRPDRGQVEAASSEGCSSLLTHEAPEDSGVPLAKIRRAHGSS